MSQNTAQAQAVTYESEKIRPFGMRDKFGYLLGDFGNDFFFILVSSFLMVYYTDIFGISAATVGGLFLVARLWDAVADVTWGRFIDNRKPSKHGKFKPWIFRMSFPLVISGVLMFVHIPGMSDGFYLAYAFVTYILWGTLYSTVNIPYGSMASVITGDPVKRTTLVTFRAAGAMSAMLIINVFVPLIVFVDNKPDANRFMWVAIIFGILAISCYMACYKLSTERIVLPETEGKKSNFSLTFKGLLKNKPLIWIIIATLIFQTCSMLIGTVNVYLFKDYFGNSSVLSIVGFIQTGAAFIAIPLINPCVARFGKKETASVGLLLAGSAFTLLYFLPNLTVTPFLSILAVAMFGFAFFNIMAFAFVTDVIDYHEYLTGLREDGTVYSICSMARKVGQALAGGLGGVAIGYVGYNASLNEQAQGTLDGIHTIATLVPGIIFFVVLLILIFLYPLNKKLTIDLSVELAEKRKERNV